MDEFVYFPVEEVDAPETVGALWSTVNVKDALKPTESYCLAFTSQPPLAPKLAVYVPSASPVNVIVFVPLPTPFPALFTTETVGVPAFDLAPVQESLDFLRSGAVPYEVRTTVVRELHTADDLRALAAWIEGVQAWHLQSFIDADSVLGGEGRFHAWDPDDLRALLPELQAVVPGAQLRGVD